jgi:Uma2 family endonuclease
MDEYITNGVRLGWLLDPIENQAYIYTPGQSSQRIDVPTVLSGEPVLPGFRFDFREIS